MALTISNPWIGALILAMGAMNVGLGMVYPSYTTNQLEENFNLTKTEKIQPFINQPKINNNNEIKSEKIKSYTPLSKTAILPPTQKQNNIPLDQSDIVAKSRKIEVKPKLLPAPSILSTVSEEKEENING